MPPKSAVSFARLSTPDELKHSAQSNPRSSLSSSRDSTPRPGADDITPLLCNAFSTLPAYFRNVRNADDVIQAELSLGAIVAEQFHSHIRPCDWTRISAMCAAAMHARPSKTTAFVELWYRNPAPLLAAYNRLVPPIVYTSQRFPPSMCITITPAEEILSCRLQTTCFGNTIAVGPLLRQPLYDLRIHFNYSQSLPDITARMQVLPEGWTSRRSHVRTSYWFAAAPDWRIDLTAVTENGGTIYEVAVQMELTRDTIPTGFVDELRQQMAARGLDAWQQLIGQMNTINGRRREFGPASHPDLFVDCALASDAVTRSVTAAVSRAMGGHGVSRRTYAGPNFAELTRSRWAMLCSDHAATWIGDKTDGMPMTLIIAADSGVCSLDRNGIVVSLQPNWPEWHIAVMNIPGICSKGATILDAELVRNSHPERTDAYSLIVVDLLMDNGMPCYQQAFGARQQSMRQLVSERLAPAGRVNRPFSLHAREFVPLADYSRLYKHMTQFDSQTSPPERLITYSMHGQFVLSGLVFVHAPRDKAAAYYEWKPAHKKTVDFLLDSVATTNAKFNLSVVGDDSVAISCGTIQLSSAQLDDLSRISIDEELVARIPPRLQFTRPVVECRYDPDSGEWILVRFRVDKRTPSHFSATLDALKAMIKPIVHAEIVAAIRLMK